VPIFGELARLETLQMGRTRRGRASAHFSKVDVVMRIREPAELELLSNEGNFNHLLAGHVDDFQVQRRNRLLVIGENQLASALQITRHRVTGDREVKAFRVIAAAHPRALDKHCDVSDQINFSFAIVKDLHNNRVKFELFFADFDCAFAASFRDKR